MTLNFSIIVPVYNRPNEIDELLDSLIKQTFKNSFEVVIVEDGSINSSEEIVQSYQGKLDLKYFYKENSGAGASRNYGMQRALGNYFIILDSDVIVPSQYLDEVNKTLLENFTDAFGGPDTAHDSFTNLQKAINYSMTSVFTTGGIRGKKKSVGKFQPRSFNLGLSKQAFEITKGFSKMRVGEDIDLTFRLWENGFETQLIEKAFVYHKRRSTLKQFYKQTFNFGTARPFLNRKFPETAKITYWFPSVFVLGLIFSSIIFIFGFWQFSACIAIYLLLIFVDSLLQNKSIPVAFLSIATTITQFFGYGLGFLQAKFLK